MVNFIPAHDSMVIDKIRGNILQGWEELYDEHASSMLAVIYELTGDKEKGEQMLIEIFTSSRFKSFVLSVTNKLRFNLCFFVFSYTIKHLKENGQDPDMESISRLPTLMQFLYQKYNAHQETADEWKASKPTYKWLPLFGVNIYG